MKINLFLKMALMIVTGLFMFSLTSCDDDDDSGTGDPDFTGSLVANDQTIENNTVIVSTITMSRNGWIAIYRDNGVNGPLVSERVSEPELVEAGVATNVEVTLTETVEDGETLWIMLHRDDGDEGTFEYGQNNLDEPLTDEDGEPVVASILVTGVNEPGESFTAADQIISQNRIMVSSATFNNPGWIVIHRDDSGSPVVPEIISVPRYVQAGTTTDIEVELEEDIELAEGETLWVMLHTDDGEEEVYEFDGENGLDAPITDDNDEVLTSPIVVTPASITAGNQAVVDDQIVVAEVNTGVDGWVAVHNDDGAGNMTEEIVGTVQVSAGTNSDVVVDLDPDVTYTPGQSLFLMLHIDDDPVDEFNFPGEDVPEVYGFGDNNVITSQIAVE